MRKIPSPKYIEGRILAQEQKPPGHKRLGQRPPGLKPPNNDVVSK